MFISTQRNTFLLISISSALIFCCLLLTNCKTKSVTGVNVPDTPHETLSSYHFFDGNVASLVPSEGVLPYELISPLFSDYSYKERFVWMPDGKTANYTTDHVLDFPVGAVLIKNFFYLHDERDASKGRRLMETRLLVNRGEEWDAYGYSWNDEQTEAYYDIVGDIKDVTWINEAGEEQRVDYIIPNKNQCKGCHAYDNKLLPIGPKVRNLNKDFAFEDGVSNQLNKWADIGYLSNYNLESDHPAVAKWDDGSISTHERSMAYLDINCGHCHNPKGAGSTSGLTLLADSEIGLKLGVYKPTVSAGAGTGGHSFSIVPGNADESIMIYRMSSTNPGAMMPELGRRLVHTEGVDLIASWINEMNASAFEAPLDSSLN